MDYLAKITEVLEPKLKGKTLTEESNFKDLGIDSLDLVDLVFQMEEALDVQFEDEELLTIKTVGDLIHLVEAKRQ
ncbi:acyl carrier protein [Beduini massiliensis]|uniref:acyl carrier protein n=1 Tax=Beduini massiliensis TaxID=1585974 RepID=UPI00059AA032|nr:phosphopantetheine-binding protein [Beduini massiliensis]